MYGYRCKYCDGTVQQQVLRQQAFPHNNGFVILENVPIGVCDKCGHRYYHSSVLHRVEEIASGERPADRTEQVPVGVFS